MTRTTAGDVFVDPATNTAWRCAGRQPVERLELRGDVAPRTIARVDRAEPPASILRIGRDDARGPGLGPRRRPERPLRPAELGAHGRIRQQRFDGARGEVGAIKAPPAGAVAGKAERPVGPPSGLVNRLGLPARQASWIAERAGSRDRRHPQLGPVPRHLRVPPRQPRQGVAAWTEPWRRVEIVAGREDLGFSGGRPVVVGRPFTGRLNRNSDQRVDRFAGSRVVLADTDQTAARAVENRVGIEPLAGRSDRERRAAPEAVNALVGEVGKVDLPAGDDVRRAAVLMDPRPHVEPVGDDVADRAVGAAAHEHIAATLVRPSLHPVHIVAVDGDTAEPQPLRRHRRRRQR